MKNFSFIFLMLFVLACHQTRSKSYKEDVVRTIEPSELKVFPIATPLIKEPEIVEEPKYKIIEHTVVKKAKRGAKVKIYYPEIKSEPASQATININKEINNKRDELMTHFLEHFEGTKRKDTAVYISIEPSIWANELLSVEYFQVTMTEMQTQEFRNIFFEQYSLSKGIKLKPEDIFKESFNDYWFHWFKKNVDLGSSLLGENTWESYPDGPALNGESFEGTYQQLFEKLLTSGCFTIANKGDLTFKYITAHNFPYEYSLPYQEIKDFLKIKPKH